MHDQRQLQPQAETHVRNQMAEVQAELQALKASRQRHAEQQKDQVSLHRLAAHMTCCAALSITLLQTYCNILKEADAHILP